MVLFVKDFILKSRAPKRANLGVLYSYKKCLKFIYLQQCTGSFTFWLQSIFFIFTMQPYNAISILSECVLQTVAKSVWF